MTKPAPLYEGEINDVHAMIGALNDMLKAVGPKFSTLYPDSIEIKMRHDGGDRDVFLIYWDPEIEMLRVEVLP